MKWNWQQKDWPHFTYDANKITGFETDLLHQSGLLFGAFTHLSEKDKDHLKVELISNEAVNTSEIEGEYLNRDSIQSSILRHFGLHHVKRKIEPAPQVRG